MRTNLLFFSVSDLPLLLEWEDCSEEEEERRRGRRDLEF